MLELLLVVMDLIFILLLVVLPSEFKPNTDMKAFRKFVRCFRTISEAQLDSDSRMLRLKWNGGTSLKPRTSNTAEVTSQHTRPNDHGIFPFVWLRDNCQCEKCFHQMSMGRLFLMENLDCRISPTEVKVAPEHDTLTLSWPDDHTSTFEADWLFNRDFNNIEVGQKFDSLYIPPRLWGSDLQERIPTISYSKFLTDDAVLYDWLKGMEEYGLVLLEGVPKETRQLHMIGKRVCFLRPTNYGETFQVVSKSGASNLAYTSARLGLHTDLPFYHQPPGVQLLHCIQQSEEGGANEFVDGFKAAADLKNDYPKEFDVLTTVPIDFFNIGSDYYRYNMHFRCHVIGLSANGDVREINYNDQVRDSRLRVPGDRVQDVYDALKAFHRCLYQPRNTVYTKLREGDVVAFDNTRVLHGRLGYTIKDADARRLEGAYIDWDDMRSRRRVLQEDLGIAA